VMSTPFNMAINVAGLAPRPNSTASRTGKVLSLAKCVGETTVNISSEVYPVRAQGRQRTTVIKKAIKIFRFSIITARYHGPGFVALAAKHGPVRGTGRKACFFGGYRRN